MPSTLYLPYLRTRFFCFLFVVYGVDVVRILLRTILWSFGYYLFLFLRVFVIDGIPPTTITFSYLFISRFLFGFDCLVLGWFGFCFERGFGASDITCSSFLRVFVIDVTLSTAIILSFFSVISRFFRLVLVV